MNDKKLAAINDKNIENLLFIDNNIILKEDIDQLIKKARESEEEGSIKKALEIYKKIVLLQDQKDGLNNPFSALTMVNIGGLYRQLNEYSKAEEYALKLFESGQKWASKMGLILVDTKYEFGIYEDELIVIDEIHTPDSSRYWVKDQYEERFKNSKPQKMLDKENIRQWLIDKGFQGEGTPPQLTDDIRSLLADKYIELYKALLGRDFVPEIGDVRDRIKYNLSKHKII